MDDSSVPSLATSSGVQLGVLPASHVRHCSRPCAISRFPLEIWLDILFADGVPGAHTALVIFSAVCPHSRWLLFDRIARGVTVFSQQLYTLDVNLVQLKNTNTASPFDYTKALRVLGPVRDLKPLPRTVVRAFPAITWLEIILRPVSWPKNPSAWHDFGVAVAELGYLHELPSLVHLTLYLSVDHDYRPVEIDIGELDILRLVSSLRTLVLRISGGADISSQKDILLPPDLTRLVLSVEVLALIERRAWTSPSAAVTTLEIEDPRSRCHMRRSSYYDSARQLSTAMSAALPGWTSRLLTLSLMDVTLDYTAVRALALLIRLTRLDLHPVGVELTHHERHLLESDCPAPPASTGTHRSMTNIVSDAADPFLHPRWARVSSLITPLKHVLCRLSALRVLHMAGCTDLWPSTPRSDMSDSNPNHPPASRPLHLALWMKLAHHVHPALSLWNFGDGADDARKIYHHIPTCQLCANQPANGRSVDCILYERTLRESVKSPFRLMTGSDISDKFDFESE